MYTTVCWSTHLLKPPSLTTAPASCGPGFVSVFWPLIMVMVALLCNQPYEICWICFSLRQKQGLREIEKATPLQLRGTNMKTAFTSLEYKIIFQSQMKFFEGNSLLVHANADDSDFPKPSNITVLREMYTTMQILQNQTLPKLLYHTKVIQYNWSPRDIHKTIAHQMHTLPKILYHTKAIQKTILHQIFTKAHHT